MKRPRHRTASCRLLSSQPATTRRCTGHLCQCLIALGLLWTFGVSEQPVGAQSDLTGTPLTSYEYSVGERSTASRVASTPSAILQHCMQYPRDISRSSLPSLSLLP